MKLFDAARDRKICWTPFHKDQSCWENCHPTFIQYFYIEFRKAFLSLKFSQIVFVEHGNMKTILFTLCFPNFCFWSYYFVNEGRIKKITLCFICLSSYLFLFSPLEGVLVPLCACLLIEVENSKWPAMVYISFLIL